MGTRLPISAASSEPGRARADSRAWLSALRGSGPEREAAVARLHELLLRAAHFEVSRRRAALAHVRGEELDDIALQAADDALVAVLGKLDDYRGASRFTTWAYKSGSPRGLPGLPRGLRQPARARKFGAARVAKPIGNVSQGGTS